MLDDGELESYIDDANRGAVEHGCSPLDERAVVRVLVVLSLPVGARHCRASLRRAHPAVQFEIVRRRANVFRGAETRNPSACLVGLVRAVTSRLRSDEAVRRPASSLCVPHWQVESDEEVASWDLIREAARALDKEEGCESS